jgi:hypothetical protein
MQLRQAWTATPPIVSVTACLGSLDDAPENLAVVRHIAKPLKAEKSLKRSIAGKRLAAGWDDACLETVFSKAL